MSQRCLVHTYFFFFFCLDERREHLVFHNLIVFHGGFGWHVNTSDGSHINTTHCITLLANYYGWWAVLLVIVDGVNKRK